MKLKLGSGAGVARFGGGRTDLAMRPSVLVTTMALAGGLSAALRGVPPSWEEWKEEQPGTEKKKAIGHRICSWPSNGMRVVASYVINGRPCSFIFPNYVTLR